MTSSEQDSVTPGGGPGGSARPPWPVPGPPPTRPASASAGERPAANGGADAPGNTGLFGVSMPKPAPEPPTVDEVTARLDALEELPVSEHVVVFEAVHRTLQDTLAAVDGS